MTPFPFIDWDDIVSFLMVRSLYDTKLREVTDERRNCGVWLS